MTAAMSSPVTRRSDWQPGHVPRLSYRNPIPSGEIVQQKGESTGPSCTQKPSGQGLSIREIREALPRDAPNGAGRPQATVESVQMPQKQKRSFLGGIFAKEPSMAALDQVAQQMLTQHGSISPKTVPYVSSQKMPDHVPRVNSKWDGVPDYVKMREKQEKGQMKIMHRNSIRPTDYMSRSTDLDEDSSVIRRRNSNAASTADSWDSRSTGSRPVFQDNLSMRPASIYSTSSSGSTHPIPNSPPVADQPYRSLTGSKSSVASPYSPGHAASTPRGPQRLQSSQSTSTQSTTSSDHNRSDFSPSLMASSIDAIAEYASSSATTPLDRSPQTLAPLLDDDNKLNTLLRGEAVLPSAANNKKPVKQSVGSRTDGAKSATARSSQRAGLGLQTNNLVAPWESQKVPQEMLRSPQSATSSYSRSKGRLFGKEKK